jgi:hypothetical protein
MSVSKARIEIGYVAVHPKLLRRVMVLLVVWWGLSKGAAGAAFVFNDVTEQTGIDFIHTDGGTGNYYVMETVTAGLALFDYDGDGDIDIYFLNSRAMDNVVSKTAAKNALYRNDGRWKFTNVTEQSGLGDTGFGLGVAVGDYDNDGDQDV